MKQRIGLGLSQVSSDPEDFADVVRSVREHGFDSIWLADVLTVDGPDVTVALTWAAQVDPRLRLGTTMLLPGRNPIRLAKSLATLDRLSGGRLLVTFVPGLAQGPERDAVGVPVADRGRLIEETLPKLRAWWSGEEVEGLRVRPTPHQDPLECWLGGIAPAALERCGRFGDGWLTSGCTPAEALAGRLTIQEAASRAGREISPEHFGVSIAWSSEPLDDAALQRFSRRGVDPHLVVPVGRQAAHDHLEAFLEAGLSKFVLRPLPSAVPWREQVAALADAVLDLQT